MKKLLEVVQYSDLEIRFNTDIDVMKDPSVIHDTTVLAIMCMASKLRGEKERSVLAILRALAIADLAVSINREEMIKSLDQTSHHYEQAFKETRDEFVRQGKLIVVTPGDPKMSS